MSSELKRFILGATVGALPGVSMLLSEAPIWWSLLALAGLSVSGGLIAAFKSWEVFGPSDW